MKRLFIICAFLLFFLPCIAQAGTYWVDASGGAANWAACEGADPGAGSRCSMAQANAGADDDDIVYFMTGTYTTALSPTNSGSEGHIITFMAYPGQTPVLENAATYPMMYFSDDHYIKVDGLSITAASVCGIYIVKSSSYIEIANLSVSGVSIGLRIFGTCQGDPLVYTCGPTHIWVHDVTFTNNGGIGAAPDCADDGGNIYLGSTGAEDNTSNITFENNTLTGGGHHNAETFALYTVFRNNTLANYGWLEQEGCTVTPSPRDGKYGNRALQIYDGQNRAGMYGLWEGNNFGHAAKASDGGFEGNVAITSPKNIVRHNSSYNSEQSGFYFKSGANSYGKDNRVYNNTVYYNGNDSELAVSGIELRLGFVWAAGQTQNVDNVVKNNLIYGNNQGDTGCYFNDCATLNTIGNNYLNADGDPLFESPSVAAHAVPVLTLQSGSPAIDGGAALTTVHADDTGTGTALVVTDALYFQDGTWGSSLSSIQPDWIAVGTVGNIVQIASIDYATNTITLANSISRSDGDSIWLYKKSDGTQVLYGTAPDYGAYEYESGAAPTKPTVTLGVGPLWTLQ